MNPMNKGQRAMLEAMHECSKALYHASQVRTQCVPAAVRTYVEASLRALGQMSLAGESRRQIQSWKVMRNILIDAINRLHAGDAVLAVESLEIAARLLRSPMKKSPFHRASKGTK